MSCSVDISLDTLLEGNREGADLGERGGGEVEGLRGEKGGETVDGI